MCRRLAGNEADALDATQEALINISKRIDRFDGRSAFSTWAYRVATNACLDELRRRARRPTPGLPEHEPAVDGAPAFDAGVAGRLDIEAALAELPAEFRAPVVLRDQLGMDYAEISEVLSIPPGTVRSRIARGRRRLAELLEGNQNHQVERPNPEAP